MIPMLQLFAYKIQWVWRSFEILFHAVSKQAPLKSAVKLTLFGIGHLSAKAVGRCLGRDGKSFGKLKFEHVAGKRQFNFRADNPSFLKSQDVTSNSLKIYIASLKLT